MRRLTRSLRTALLRPGGAHVIALVGLLLLLTFAGSAAAESFNYKY